MARRRVWWLAGGAGAAALLCVALPLAALLVLPRAPRTHRDNVADALARRGVAYQEIVFVQSYEESVELDFYRAQVLVRTADGRTASGWIGCEDRDTICFLELRDLGVVGERLPDLAREPLWPWLAWAESALRRAGIGMR